MTEYRKGKLIMKLEQFFVFPLIFIGYLLGFFLKNNIKEKSILCLLRNADIGGSTLVHADILEILKDKKLVLVFTKKAANNNFLDRFTNTNGQIYDISKLIDNKVLHFINIIYRGILVNHINNSKLEKLIGAECLYFYKLLPYLRKNLITIDITHVNKWQHYTIRFIDFISLRIYSSIGIKREAVQQYHGSHLSDVLRNKLKFIEYKTDILEYSEPNNNRLEVIYIGRGSDQKRVHLIGAIAAGAYKQNLNINFSFIGDVSNILPAVEYPFCKFYGNITDKKMLQDLERKSDVLLLTSLFEGLPLVVMEMMALGRVVVSTAVSSIPDYIEDNVTGKLIWSKNETEIVQEAIAILKELSEKYSEIKSIGIKARAFAIEKFNPDKFREEILKCLG